MYLLDTEVVSELRRRKPHQDALEWFSDVAPDQVFLSAVTVGEIQTGIEFARAKDASRAAELESWMGKLMDSQRVYFPWIRRSSASGESSFTADGMSA